MAANSSRNTSFGLDQNSTKSNGKAKLSRRRKGLIALSSAASAVGIIGLSAHVAKADVLANTFDSDGQDTTLNSSFDWLDLSNPTVDNPANSTGFPGAQDIAQFDSANTNFDDEHGTPGSGDVALPSVPTFSFTGTNTETWAGINVNSPGTAQIVAAGATVGLTVVIAPNYTGTAPLLVLGNTAYPTAGSPSGISVVGTNGLSLNVPLGLATKQTWSAGVITNTTGVASTTGNGAFTVTNAAIGTPFTESGTLALNGNALTVTGGSDGTSGNFTFSGNISDGSTPGGSIVINSAQGTRITTQVTLGGIVTNTYSITAGTLTLSGSNTFTGGITVTSGQVTVGSLANTGGVNALGGPIDFKGGYLGVGGTALNNLNANSVNGNPAGATSTWNNVPLDLNLGSAANPFTVSQNLTGSSSIIKTGPGPLTLSGNNTYSGGTTLIQGTIIVPNFQGLGTNNNSVIAGSGGSIINIAVGPTTLVAPATYGGNITSTASTLQINLTSPLFYPKANAGQGQTQAYSANQAGTGNLIVGGSTLDLNGPITNAGVGLNNNATLILDYGTGGATSSILTTPIGLGTVGPLGATGPLTGASLSLGGGTLQLNGGTTSPLTKFAATAVSGGANVINDTAGVPINLGFVNYTTTGAVTVNASTGATTTAITSTTTFNRANNAFGATLELNGPITSGDVTPFQVLDNNTLATPLVLVAETGNVGTNGPNGTIGSIVQTPTNSSGTVTLTGVYDSSYYSGYATFGLSNWAVVTPSVSGTSYITSSDAVPGFFSQTNISINANPTAIQSFSSQANNAPGNYDIIGPGEPRFAGNHAFTTLRFNATDAGAINVNGNNLDQFTIAPLMEGGAFLETPNVGANNLLINDFSAGALSGVTTQVLDPGRNNGSGQDFVIWQNNTQGLMVWSTGIGDAGSASPANGAFTEAGPGTIALDASSTYTAATSIDGGTIQIQFAQGLGTINAGNNTAGTNTVNLNGGSLVANGSFALDNSTTGAGHLNRNVVVGPTGGNLTSSGGDVFTIDGNISGSGNLTLGNNSFFSVASANTHNSVVNFSNEAGVGLVVLSGNNTYTGTTTVLAGSLQADGSYTNGNFTVNNGATMGGIPTLPASSSVTVQSGGTFYPGDAGVGAFTVGSLTLNTGSSLNFAFSATSPVNPIQINNSLVVPPSNTANPVALYLFQEFTASQYQNSGTYVLLQVPTSQVGSGLTTTPQFLATPGGGLTENSFTIDGFNLANPQVLTTYALSAVSIGGGLSDIDLEISSKVFGASWNLHTGGTWDASADWLSSAATGAFNNPPIPNGEVDTATFGPIITAPAIITVDSSPNSAGTITPVTVGNVIFNSSNSYTIAAGSSSSLTLTNGQSTATIVDELGQHTISIPLVMTAGANIEVNNPTDVLTISSPITGTGGVNFVNGQGTLVLTNTNNNYSGPTSIASSFGVLQLGNGVSAGALGNTQPFTNNGTIVLNQPAGTYTFANTVNGTGGLIQEGTGSEIVLTGTNTFAGATVVNANTALQIGNAAAITINGTVLDNGLIDMNGQPASLGSLSGSGTVDNVTAGGSVTLIVGTANTNSTFSGVIKNTSGTVSLSKQGAGTLVLTGTNLYTGTTTIPNNGGNLELTASYNIPPTQPIYNDNQINGALILGNNVTVANPIIYNVSASEFIQVVSGGSAEITGPVSVSAGAAQFRFGFPGTGTLTFTGPITDGTPVNGVPGTGLQNNVDGFFTAGNFVLAGNAAMYVEPSIGFGRQSSGETGLNLLLENNASITIFGTDGLKDATDTGGIDYGEGTSDPYVNVTLQNQASLYAGAGTIALDTQTIANITNTLTLNGGTVTAGALSWTPPTGSQGTSSAVVTFNGGVLIAGASTTNFTPIGSGDGTTYNFAFDVSDGGALIDTNGFNDEFTAPAGFQSVGQNNTDGGLTKLGTGELVLANAWGSDSLPNPNSNDPNNPSHSYQGPTNVEGGLLDFNTDVQVSGTTYIQVSPGAAVGIETGSTSDNAFLSVLTAAPNPQSGALAIEPADLNNNSAAIPTNIDFTGLAYGEGPGFSNTNGTYVLNMAVTLAGNPGLGIPPVGLLGMSIGAGSALLNGPVTYNGTITPGRLNGNAGAPFTYQLGGGGTLVLTTVSFGTNATGGIPLVNTKTSSTPTNLLVENGGEVELITTNTYTGTTTIQGVNVATIPSAELPPGSTVPTTMLERSALFVAHLGDPGSATGTGSSIGGTTGFSAASNLVIDGGILGYIGKGDTSSRLFTIGGMGATLTANESGTIPLVFSNTGSLAYASDATNAAVTLTLNGTAGTIVPTGTVGTTTFVNALESQLSDPTGGTLALVVSGTNAWALTNANNSYSGGTTISSGILELATPSTIAPAGGAGGGQLGNIDGNLAVNGKLDLNGISASVGALSGTGTIDDILGGGAPNLTIGNGNVNSTFSGIIENTSGSVSLTAVGTGTLYLTGNNTYSGTTTISSGSTVSAGNATASGTVGVGPVADAGSLIINRTDATVVSFANVVSGVGSVTKLGSATVNVSGSNSYSGGTTVSAGTLQLGAVNGIGTGALTVNAGAFDLNGFSPTVAGLSGTGGVVNNSAVGTVSLTVNNTSATATTYSGVIESTGGTLGLIVAAGTLVLAGANTYTGGSTVNGGALQIGAGGTSGSITGAVVDNSSLIINRSDTAGFTFGNSVSGALGSVSVTGTGTVTFTGANTYGGTTTVSNGTLVIGKVGALPTGGAVIDNSTLSIQAGSSLTPINPATITGSGTIAIGTASTPGYLSLGSTSGAQTTTTASSLVVAPGSTLNINNNSVLISFTGSNTAADSAIFADLASGYNGDKWTGTGINSSNAAANVNLYAVGYVDGSHDAGTSISGTNEILIKNTLAGDTNMDGTVNFADLLAVAQNFNKSTDSKGYPVDWADGNDNYGSTVNFSDLLLVAQNFNKTLSAGQLSQLPGSFSAAWALAELEVASAQSNNVPEPATATLMVVAAGGLLARRRRRTEKNS
jgi:autotransporter-associated beta strand protein